MHYAASLCLSVALIYNGKAIHLQLLAYLMVMLNHSIKYYCKVFLWEKEIKVLLFNLQSIVYNRWTVEKGESERERERDEQDSAVV